MKKYILLLLAITLTSCNCAQEEKSEKANISVHATTMATLYNYYADEYRALTYQAFNIARDRIDEIRAMDPANDSYAIVVDIDETVLDNSPHQALLISRDSTYPYMWNEWCELANARPVPGAVDFLQYADEQGFNIFYVSNRKEKYTQEGTMKNLLAMGFPQVTDENIMLRLERSDANPNPSDKQGRRDEIGTRGLEIVLLMGDNLGDFYTDEHGQPARRQQMESFRNEFGHKFIVLPNAIYGNWQMSLGLRNEDAADSLLLEMTKAFE